MKCTLLHFFYMFTICMYVNKDDEGWFVIFGFPEIRQTE